MHYLLFSELQIKYNTTQGTETAVLDQIMADELRGENSNPFKVYQGLINHEDDLAKRASFTKNTSLIMNLEFRRFFSVRQIHTGVFYSQLSTLSHSTVFLLNHSILSSLFGEVTTALQNPAQKLCCPLG